MPTGVAIRDVREQLFDAADRILLRDGPGALTSRAVTTEPADDLTDALTALFGSVAVAIVALVTFRDELRPAAPDPARGRPGADGGVTMIAACLAAERDLCRIAPDAEVDALAPTLIGAGHLLFADRRGARPERDAVRKAVTTVIAECCADRQPKSTSPRRK